MDQGDFEDPFELTLRARVEWLRVRAQRDLELAPDVLWHYTDAFAMEKILTGERLRATNTAFLNDDQELAYGLDRVAARVDAYPTEGLSPTTQRLLRGLTASHPDALRSWMNKHLSVFVTCFCESGDLLSQWRSYAGADKAGGYALGIGTRPPLAGWPQSAPGDHGLTLRRVLYDPSEQDETCDELLNALIPILNDGAGRYEENEFQRAFSLEFINGVADLASCFKHPAFAEEREWRFVYARSLDRNPLDLQHRASRGLIVPFVDLELPSPIGQLEGHLPIRFVNLGPGPDPVRKRAGVTSLLGLLRHYAGVEIAGSDAPLRI